MAAHKDDEKSFSTQTCDGLIQSCRHPNTYRIILSHMYLQFQLSVCEKQLIRHGGERKASLKGTGPKTAPLG